MGLGEKESSWLFRATNQLIDFFSVDRHIFRGFDADADLVTPDRDDGDNDVVADDNGF